MKSKYVVFPTSALLDVLLHVLSMSETHSLFFFFFYSHETMCEVCERQTLQRRPFPGDNVSENCLALLELHAS